MISIVIPARNEQFLQQTIQSLLDNATGQIEIIVVLDGYWPDPPLRDDPRLRIIHRGKSQGMRNAINSAVSIASGDFIMKIDAHCMVAPEFDVVLTESCGRYTVIIPRRKRLDAANWCLVEDGRPDIDYEYLSVNLHGKPWDSCTLGRKEIQLDENMSFQGSCWLMRKDYYHWLELMDEGTYGPFSQEAQEIALKCWLSGGQVLTNKKTWYAHLHKGSTYGRGYPLSKSTVGVGEEAVKRWQQLGKAWHKQIHDFQWLIDKFNPPGW